MHVVFLLLVIFYYGTGNPPDAYSRAMPDAQTCAAYAQVLEAKLDLDPKIQGVAIRCGEVDIDPVNKT